MGKIVGGAKALSDLVLKKGLDAFGPDPVDNPRKQQRRIEALIASGRKPPKGEIPILTHISPNKFGEFDHSYIGAGEGNQFYGSGTYLAEGKGTEQFYRDQARRFKTIDLLEAQGKHQGDRLADHSSGRISYRDNSLIPAVNAREVLVGNMDKDRAIDSLLFATPEEARWRTPETDKRMLESFEEMLADFPNLGLDPGIYQYGVDWDVPPSSLLDLDKYLDEAPRKIQDRVGDAMDILTSRQMTDEDSAGALERLYQQYKNGLLSPDEYYDRRKKVPAWDPTKKTIDEIRRLETVVGPRALSEAMYEAGIPGYRYLDGMSRYRRKRNPKYNYVALGDKDPRILYSNRGSADLGALAALAGGSAAALGGGAALNRGGTTLEDIIQHYGGPVEQRIDAPISPKLTKAAEVIEEIPALDFLFGGLRNWLHEAGYGEATTKDRVGAALDLL